MLKQMVKIGNIVAVAEEMTKDIADPIVKQRKINTIIRDWANRKTWLPFFVYPERETVLPEAIACLREARYRGWIEYYRAESAATRIRAIRVIIQATQAELDAGMKTGIIVTAPEKIDSTITLPGMPFELDRELKQAILEDQERQRLEKERQDAKSSG
jgi:hypothetical protein